MTGATALGVGSAVGSAGGGIISSVIQGEYNKREAQRNRNWQERMSNTAMQRAVADYQKAGLSPAMMFAGGGGNTASTPSGSTASISKPDFGIAGVMNSIANILNTDRKIDYLENMNRNTAGKSNFEQRKYTRKDLNSLYTDINDLKF